MKSALYFFALFSLSSSVSVASGIPIEIPKINPEDIAEESEKSFFFINDAPGQKKDTLFFNAKQWIAESFKSSKAVIDLEDKAEGVIVGNGVIPYPTKDCAGACELIASWKYRFKVKIDLKDNRYRMSFSEIEFFSIPAYIGGGYVPPVQRPLLHKKEVQTVKDELQKLSATLAKYAENKKTDDKW